MYPSSESLYRVGLAGKDWSAWSDYNYYVSHLTLQMADH